MILAACLVTTTYLFLYLPSAFSLDPSDSSFNPPTFTESPTNTPQGTGYNPGIPSQVSGPGITISGSSAWSYGDIADAGTKHEGSHQPFDNKDLNLYDSNNLGRDFGPHGGYAAVSNKCGICHSVHRAQGFYALTRSDSPDDACSYCHVGDHRHSVLSAYWKSANNIHTQNGHTIGGGPDIPDSSVWQWTEAKQFESIFNDESQIIQVRHFSPTKLKMFKFSNKNQRMGPTDLRCQSCHEPHNNPWSIWRPYRSDGTVWVDGYKLLLKNPSGNIKIEDTDVYDDIIYRDKTTSAIQPVPDPVTDPEGYAAAWETMQSAHVLIQKDVLLDDGKIDPVIDTNNPDNYVIGPNSNWVDVNGDQWAGVKVKDTKAYARIANIERIADKNTDSIVAPDSTYTGQDLKNGIYGEVSTDKGIGSPNQTGYTPYKYSGMVYVPNPDPTKPGTPRIEEVSLNFWCANCHNLSIAGKTVLGFNWRQGSLGNEVLSDKSHVSPYMATTDTFKSTMGVQCYGCHNSDMARVAEAGTYANYNETGQSVTFTDSDIGCGRCHITPKMYRKYKEENYQTFEGVPGGNSLSDFPHSGSDDGEELFNDLDLLYDINPPNPPNLEYTTPYRPYGQIPDGSDKICKSCHQTGYVIGDN